MNPEPLLPPIVITLWRVTIVVGFLVLLPVAVYWLHSLWRAAASIRRYAADGLVAARGIEANASSLIALNSTIDVATEVLTAAGAVAGRLETLASALEARSREGR
jgi:hypothetical protein